MRAVSIILSGAALLALSACGKSDDKAASGNQSAQEVASELKKVSLEPGEWETTQEIVDVSMEGAPKDMPSGMIDAMKGQKNVVKTCITPEQAEKPDADFLTAQKDNKCTYSGFEMSGGTVKGSITCPAEGGGTMNASIEGIYTANSYATNMEMVAAGLGGMPGAAPGGMSMHMKMKVTGKRIGECPG